jgi:hypothetical protein
MLLAAKPGSAAPCTSSGQLATQGGDAGARGRDVVPVHGPAWIHPLRLLVILRGRCWWRWRERVTSRGCWLHLGLVLSIVGRFQLGAWDPVGLLEAVAHVD